MKFFAILLFILSSSAFADKGQLSKHTYCLNSTQLIMKSVLDTIKAETLPYFGSEDMYKLETKKTAQEKLDQLALALNHSEEILTNESYIQMYRIEKTANLFGGAAGGVLLTLAYPYMTIKNLAGDTWEFLKEGDKELRKYYSPSEIFEMWYVSFYQDSIIEFHQAKKIYQLCLLNLENKEVNSIAQKDFVLDGELTKANTMTSLKRSEYKNSVIRE